MPLVPADINADFASAIKTLPNDGSLSRWLSSNYRQQLSGPASSRNRRKFPVEWHDIEPIEDKLSVPIPFPARSNDADHHATPPGDARKPLACLDGCTIGGLIQIVRLTPQRRTVRPARVTSPIYVPSFERPLWKLRK